MEEWRPILLHPGENRGPEEYQVSSFGRVVRISDGFEPKQKLDRNRLSVMLTSKEGNGQSYRRVAHLVAQAYLAAPTVKIKRVRHKDGDLSNCRLDNLEIHSWTLWE